IVAPAGEALPGTIYLRGLVRTAYTGRAFTIDPTDFDSGLPPPDFPPSVPTVAVGQQVRLQSIQTPVVYAARFPYQLDLPPGYRLVHDVEGALRTSRPLRPGVAYTVTSQVPVPD